MADELEISSSAYNKIANKIRKMIKQRIKDLGLIDTGLMYDSIFVYPDYKGNFTIESEDYFKYLDEPYNITEWVFNSEEFLDFVNETIEADIEKQIIKGLK